MHIAYSGPVTPFIRNNEVVFQYDDTSVKDVSIAGSFNLWDKDATHLNKNNDGAFEADLSLDEGNYEYKFFVNGKKWLPSGDNLKISLTPDELGNLQIKEIKPDYNTPYSKKIFISGEYFGRMDALRTRETDTSQTLWRLQEPQNDIDIRVTGKINKNIEIFGEVNYTNIKNGVDKRMFYLDWQNEFLITNKFRKNEVELDEAHIQITTPYYKIKGYLNEQVYIMDDPLHTFEAIDMADNIYFTDEKRPVANKTNIYTMGKGFGLGTAGIVINSNPFGLDSEFFLANSSAGSRDFLAFHTSKKIGPFKLGFPYFFVRDMDGIWGNPDNTQDQNIRDDDLNNGWIEYPRGSGKWWHYSMLRVIEPNDKNMDRNIGIDLSFNYNKVNIFAEFLKKRVHSAGAVLLRGEEVNTNFSDYAPGERSFGGTLDGSILYLGGNYQLNKYLKVELSFKELEGKSKTIDYNATLVYTPKKSERMYGALRYTSDELYAGLEIERVERQGYPITARNFALDDKGFYGLNVQDAGKELNITSVFHWHPYNKINIHYANRIRNYNLLVQGSDAEWSDVAHRFRIVYSWLKNLSTNADWRFAKYNINEVRSFTDFYAAVEYKLNEDINITAGYGNNYKTSLEKGYGRPLELMRKYYIIAESNDSSLSTPSRLLTEDMILDAETELSNENRFGLEIDVRF